MKTWQQINMARVPYINYATRKTNAVLKDIRTNHVNRVKEFGEAALGMLSEGNIKQAFTELFVDIYTVTGVAFAKKQVRNIKSIKNKVDWNILESRWVEDMRTFALTRCGRKIEISTQTFYDDIVNITRSVFSEVAETGWGADRIAKEIMRRQGDIDAFRALRIARTEIVGASNQGSFMGAKSFPIETKKVWITTLDGNERTTHRAMHNNEVALNEKFIVPLPDGGSEPMDYPGDPDGSAENVIQCRCGVIYEPVNSIIDQLLGE